MNPPGPGETLKQTASPADTAGAGEIELPLTDIEHLFNAPRIDPLSVSPAEVLGISGADYLFTLLNLDKKRRRTHRVALVLALGDIDPEAGDRATRALHRYAECRMAQANQELRGTYRYGCRVTAIAIFILAICVGLSEMFASDLTNWMRPLSRTTFEYGFEIIGWVILWHPIDVLVFTPLAIRARTATLKAMASMDVIVRQDSRRLR